MLLQLTAPSVVLVVHFSAWLLRLDCLSVHVLSTLLCLLV